MTKWQSYPQNKPCDNTKTQMRDYVVLTPNPNRINKTGFSLTTPCYRVELAFWTGKNFVDNNFCDLNVHYYITLPSHS